MGNLTVKFAKPYKFEGTEYDEVDLSGMDGMTIQDMIDIQKNLAGEIATLAAVEATTSFAQEVATKASGKPVEFFKLMPRAKIKQVQTAILNNLNAKVKNDPKTHVVKFDNAYTYNGDGKEDIKGKTIACAGFGNVTDTHLRHDRDGHGFLNALDHGRIAHAGNTAGRANIGRNTLERHHRACARVLRDLRLLRGGDVHDDAALEHLCQILVQFVPVVGHRQPFVENNRLLSILTISHFDFTRTESYNLPKSRFC